VSDALPATERVTLAFRRVIAAVVVFNDQVAQRTGLGLSEGQFVHLLDLYGPLTPSELGRHSGLTSGTVTGVLDRLEQLGFVRRERHPDDRRKVVVVLDQDRLNAHADNFSDQAKTLASAIARFSPSELTVVADFLEALIGEATAAGSDGPT
jgi:DNA-binding MarR family transcriptional regulator